MYFHDTEHDLTVVVDRADWGYRVAEVEVIVLGTDKDTVSKEVLQKAVEKVEHWAERLGE